MSEQDRRTLFDEQAPLPDRVAALERLVAALGPGEVVEVPAGWMHAAGMALFHQRALEKARPTGALGHLARGGQR